MTATITTRRWDPIVKVTHWSIALAVIVNAVVTEEGSGPHMRVGYGLAGILALRLVWGIIGPAEARFSAFPPSPGRAIDHLRDIAAGRHATHRSHNPLGALMAYSIWATLLVIIGTGIGMAGLPGAVRPVARTELVTGAVSDAGDEAHEHGEFGEREEGPLGEVHEGAANLLYLLILLHLAGVVFETRRSGGKLVAAMLPGQPRF